MIRNVKRYEDMSQIGHLHLMLDDDGDVIISVAEQGLDGLIEYTTNIEFCTIGQGGGGSMRTYQALRNLMVAMHEDNQDRNNQGRAFHDRDACPKCGCNDSNSTGNMVEVPDHYEVWNCNDCGWIVGMIDNSPYHNCWDFKNYEIEI